MKTKVKPVTQDTRRCPECKADWRGHHIPAMWRKMYKSRTHFSRLISIYGLDVDRSIAWRCPDCDAEFPKNT